MLDQHACTSKLIEKFQIHILPVLKLWENHWTLELGMFPIRILHFGFVSRLPHVWEPRYLPLSKGTTLAAPWFGWYSALTPPGCEERWRTSLGRTSLPGMCWVKVRKYTFLWFSLFFCQSSQSLSMKPWWRKNSGALAESSEHIVPSIRQWTRSWRFTRSISSKSLNSATDVFKTLWTTVISGGIPLNVRFKQGGPGSVGSPGGSGTSSHSPSLKGPVWTQLYIPTPFPPKPVSALCHRSRGSVVRNALLDTALQSQ